MLEIVGGLRHNLAEDALIDLVVIALFADGKIGIQHAIVETEEDALEDRVADAVPRRASDVIVA
ncbi:hypothetical protein IGS73_12340 [Janibacter indicus]|uniref:Uncharacterized protein n=1 Tax=Janibacter indicus TaxID=857417 RepID=A0A7L9IZR4_9MICO|nr:hypothetical protein [Janibacter indicus]QOK21900.1 hypothetical protein IGS73_12340 [Janibacter indicus]